YLRRGVFSCYRPVPGDSAITEKARQLSEQDWVELLHLAHTDKRLAFRRYADFYLSTSGQIYWSDTHQLSAYVDDYHGALDRRLGQRPRATEMITELYVPRAELAEFMAEARAGFRRTGVNVVYGTIRLIERDEESFLAWARGSHACVIFNLHTVHTPAGIAHTAGACRRLIDMAARRGGSFYLTYHKWATRRQVEECHPRFAEFLRLKRQYDPAERFQSDWYRHHRALFSKGAGTRELCRKP
nr:hypothetical protein [Verrucomicrobiota bacterium]